MVLFKCVLCLLAATSSVQAGYFNVFDEEDYEEELTTLASPYSTVTDAKELENGIHENVSNDSCPETPAGGMKWLLHVWDPNLGWKSETPRAIIAMVLNNWLNKSNVVIRQMELQLDMEITNFLLRSDNFALHPTQLATYIQALVALNRNPRNFHGLDLVANLLSSVNGRKLLNPFVVLALCNAHAVTFEHLQAITPYTVHSRDEGKNNTEFKAITLKALSCAVSLENGFDFSGEMNRAVECLISHQKDDGTFGNIYTTAHAIQALIASKTSQQWRKEATLSRLEEMSLLEQSVYGVYSAELALKADFYPFVKDIHPGLSFNPPRKSLGNRIHYTLRNDRRPELELTISINVPESSTLFDLMSLSAVEDANFKFSYYADSEGPHIYEVNGVPNDAEENLYWRLCRQKPIPNNPKSSMLQTLRMALTLETVDPEHHFVLWYRDQDCEVLNNHNNL